jgi:hypothetical protein
MADQTFAGMIAEMREHGHGYSANQAQLVLDRLRGLVKEWREIDQRYNDADQLAVCANELEQLLGPEQTSERTSR